jgi:hypothetical protein
MSRHATGSWGRAIETVGSRRHRAGYGAYSGNARAWCFMCEAAHFFVDCPMTPEQRFAVGQQRLART